MALSSTLQKESTTAALRGGVIFSARTRRASSSARTRPSRCRNRRQVASCGCQRSAAQLVEVSARRRCPRLEPRAVLAAQALAARGRPRVPASGRPLLVVAAAVAPVPVPLGPVPRAQMLRAAWPTHDASERTVWLAAGLCLGAQRQLQALVLQRARRADALGSELMPTSAHWTVLERLRCCSWTCWGTNSQHCHGNKAALAEPWRRTQ